MTEWSPHPIITLSDTTNCWQNRYENWQSAHQCLRVIKRRFGHLPHHATCSGLGIQVFRAIIVVLYYLYTYIRVHKNIGNSEIHFAHSARDLILIVTLNHSMCGRPWDENYAVNGCSWCRLIRNCNAISLFWALGLLYLGGKILGVILALPVLLLLYFLSCPCKMSSGCLSA